MVILLATDGIRAFDWFRNNIAMAVAHDIRLIFDKQL